MANMLEVVLPKLHLVSCCYTRLSMFIHLPLMPTHSLISDLVLNVLDSGKLVQFDTSEGHDVFNL